jgi:hypothetical protein
MFMDRLAVEEIQDVQRMLERFLRGVRPFAGMTRIRF